MTAIVVAYESRSKNAESHVLYCGPSAREAKEIQKNCTTFPRIDLFLNPQPIKMRFNKSADFLDEPAPEPPGKGKKARSKKDSAPTDGAKEEPPASEPIDSTDAGGPAPSGFATAARGQLPRQGVLDVAADAPDQNTLQA